MGIKKALVARLRATAAGAEYKDSSEFTADLNKLEDAVMALLNCGMNKPQFKKWVEGLQNQDSKSKVLKYYKELDHMIGELDEKHNEFVAAVEEFDN